MRVEGQVFKIYSKDFRGKTNYTIKLEDNPIYYRCWTNRYAGIAEPGNKIAFDAEPNPDGTSAKVTSAPVLVSAQPAVAATPVSGGGGYGADRQGSIVYQSSRKDALEFLKLAVETGALVVPAAKAKKLGFLEAALDRYTAFFFEDVNTLGAVTREAEGGGVIESEEGDGEGDDE